MINIEIVFVTEILSVLCLSTLHSRRLSLIPLCEFKKSEHCKSQANLLPDAKVIGKDRGEKGGNTVGFLEA